jgi:hypothetical protein
MRASRTGTEHGSGQDAPTPVSTPERALVPFPKRSRGMLAERPVTGAETQVANVTNSVMVPDFIAFSDT